MSSAALPSRTLVFASLVLINEGINGLQITELRRDNGDDDGDDDDDDDDEGNSTRIHSSKTSHVQSATSNLLPSSTNSQSPASTSQNHLAGSKHIGAIVGAVLGSVILVGLGIMILAKCRNRARKANKRPRGSLPSTFFTDQSLPMSQVQNSPSAILPGPLTSHPAPMQSLNTSPSNNTRTRSSLSPLFPTSPHNSQGTCNSAYRRLSTNDSDGGSHTPSEPRQFQDMQPSSSLAVPLPEKSVIAGSASSSTSGQPSSLHRDMAEFQKALEDDHKRHISNPDQSSIINDPPPKYVDSAAPLSV